MGEGGVRGSDRAHARRRLTVAQAADQLGVTVDAVRSRIKRSTIEHVKEGGRVYVLLDADQDATSHGQGNARDATRPPEAGAPDPERDELVEELRDRVRALEEANRENRRIIAALTSRIPQLEAPSEPRESPTEAAGGPGGGGAPQEPQPPSQRRSWWRRFFGF